MKLFCFSCDDFKDTHTDTVNETFNVKGESVEAQITKTFCSVCNTELFDKEQEIKNDIVVFDAYKQKVGLLTSYEIIELRKKYGLSQKTFSRLLGFGEKTITRYERGSIQDFAHDNLMRLMNNTINLPLLWEIRENHLNEREHKKIEDVIDLIEPVTIDYEPKPQSEKNVEYSYNAFNNSWGVKLDGWNK